MRDVDGRQSEIALQAAELETKHLSQVRVKTRQWLVEQEQACLSDQRTRKGHALLLAAG